MINQYTTAEGVLVQFEEVALPYQNAIEPLIERLDSQRGALFASSFEFRGRYTCWDIGFVNPPLAIHCKEALITLNALNERGKLLLDMMRDKLESHSDLRFNASDDTCIQLSVIKGEAGFSEEERSKQPSVFSLIRVILAMFKAEEPYLGLYGALAYDLIFQFERLKKKKERDAAQRDLVLYFSDEIYIVNHRTEQAFVRRYDFIYQGISTQGLARSGQFAPWEGTQQSCEDCDHKPGEYSAIVEKAKQRFSCGDLFEVVPSQTFSVNYQQTPSELFRKMRDSNPSPYGFIINLGDGEFLVGASPEMYLRKQGRRIETCPISGTVKRGDTPIEDAQNIQWLLSSEKEASELTMCTDVDRNDKSRICEAGSVQVIGRRQIEMYSRLIHTVDHVEGTLREGFDGIDAFLTHMWVVTVTGAPKLWAMQFIEDNEKSPRAWYAGAVGWFGFNGDVNTGLVLRTAQLKKGIAKVRVGATLLFDSDPDAEEAETRLKASAFLDLLRGNETPKPAATPWKANSIGKKILLIDHEDSFVHTLANYFRQTGAEVTTIRYEYCQRYLARQCFDLAVLSPGPGKPGDFKLSTTIALLLKHRLPIFGVCLGLQGIVEHFGGKLSTLSYPMHGKSSTIALQSEHPMFSEIEALSVFGRYHSLYAKPDDIPENIEVIAKTSDEVVMAIAHRTLPIYAVQFHPETILSMHKQAGLRIIFNLMDVIDETKG